VDLRSVVESLPVDSEVLCGSISSLLDTVEPVSGDDRISTAYVAELESSSTGYCEVQLAVALQWDRRQRNMILIEQLLASNDDGQ